MVVAAVPFSVNVLLSKVLPGEHVPAVLHVFTVQVPEGCPVVPKVSVWVLPVVPLFAVSRIKTEVGEYH